MINNAQLILNNASEVDPLCKNLSNILFVVSKNGCWLFINLIYTRLPVELICDIKSKTNWGELSTISSK